MASHKQVHMGEEYLCRYQNCYNIRTTKAIKWKWLLCNFVKNYNRASFGDFPWLFITE